MKTRRFARLAVAALALASAALSAAPPEPQPVSAQRGLVVSSERRASEVGLSILKAGGNAVDAAVATAFALAVTYPGAGNIGGGGFLVLHTQDGRVTTFDFREKAPLAASPTMFLDERGDIRDKANHEGILSAGVPGSVAGLELAHRKYGKLAWNELIRPAVQLADEGFPVSRYFSKNVETTYRAKFLRYPSSARVFLKPDGTAYQPGETLAPARPRRDAETNPKGRRGRDFYRGRYGQADRRLHEKIRRVDHRRGPREIRGGGAEAAPRIVPGTRHLCHGSPELGRRRPPRDA